MKSTVPAPLRELFKNLQLSISGLIDDKTLDATLKEELVEIRGQLKASIDSGDDKTDESEALKSALKSAQSTIEIFPKIIEGVQKRSDLALASIEPEVTSRLDAKLKTGELLKKEDAQSLIATARTEGETAGFTRGKLLGDRRSALALAGIPAEVAATAPDTILLGEEKDFNAARDTAKERIGKLTGLGLASAHQTVRSLAWSDTAAFDIQFTSFSDLLKANKVTAPVVAPAKLNPLLGGPGTQEPAKKTVFAM